MKPYDFVQLVLRAAGQVQGRTKLQKLVYFAGEMTGEIANLGYRPHYYGPYSADVAGAVEDLRSLRFLDQKLASGGYADPSGFEITRYDYELNADGRQMADEKAEAHPELWKQIQESVRMFNSTNYVKLSLAAKTFFLLGQTRGQTATPEELEAMTEKFGWKVTGEQIREAGELLKSTGFIQIGNS